MLKTILLSRNFETYRSGYYHQDLVNSICKETNCFVYGPGYENYSEDDCFDDVVDKSPFELGELDLVVCSTSWDNDQCDKTVDPHKKINLSKYNSFKKVYFLNKEYKKLNERFDYCKLNLFDFIFTVHPNAEKWSVEHGLNIKQLNFGIDMNRFSYDGELKKIDFAFTGSLHRSHLDYRYNVKSKLFKSEFLNYKSNYEWKALFKQVFEAEFKKYEIYWAEFGAKSIFGKSLLPFGDKYGELLKSTKCFLNTPSAVGIFNTRFFELMASKSLIICPDVDCYDNILKDGYNCIMYKPDMSNFNQVLTESIENKELRESIVANAFNDVHSHTYDSRVKKMIEIVI